MLPLHVNTTPAGQLQSWEHKASQVGTNGVMEAASHLFDFSVLDLVEAEGCVQG